MNISDCYRCKFYSHNLYLVCAVHPNGVDGNNCPDFQNNSNVNVEEIWAPQGYTFVGDELVPLTVNDDED